MFPVKYVRDNLEMVRVAAQRKRVKVDWRLFEELEERRRTLIQLIEEQKHRHNLLTGEIAKKKREGVDVKALLEEGREVSSRIRKEEEGLSETEKALNELISAIPNIPHASVPIGENASENVVVRQWGEISRNSVTAVPHYEFGERLGILQLDRGAKITGSFFPAFAGSGARLVRGLINYMIDLHVSNGFSEVWVPALVNRKSLFGTGQLPSLESDLYWLQEDDFFLIPTAEVPVTNLLRDEILEEANLPRRYCAYTPCFRREAGAYGKDTRGLVRLHQFDKVEMVSFSHPETSYEDLEFLVTEAEKVLQGLHLPYRVIELCTADLSFAAAKCYDLEVWAPGIERWLEVSSCSNFEGFQARRANIRFRGKKGKTDFLHTLNGSGLALPRVIIAILENFQTEKGSLSIPEVLQPYMGGMSEILDPEDLF
jgi:seryl-tRNA synthetase